MKADATAENRPAYSRTARFRSRARWNRKRKGTHEYQGGAQVIVVFLDKVAVVIGGLALDLVVELDAGVGIRSKEVWKGLRQCFEHGLLQTGNENCNQQRFGGRGCRFDARLRAYGFFPHGGAEEKSVLYGPQEMRRFEV
jgi:hypothetical protein